MKAKIKKLTKIITALALAAGAYFSCSAFFCKLPNGVWVNGVSVGGLSLASAEAKLRAEVEKKLSEKRLTVICGGRSYNYSFPEIYYRDFFADGLRTIFARGEYELPVFYYLNGAESVVDYICNGAEREKVEPFCTFNAVGAPFEYFEGNDGVKCDRAAALELISSSLNGNFNAVIVPAVPVLRQESVENVKERTRLLSSFTTYFDASNVPRSANIRLAAQKLNGCVLPAGAQFSFNSTVGVRSVENGFAEAKIIENGKFVTGVGGGVCQVSTTVYNAAVLAGFAPDEYHPHSLSVGYVAPSRDAMVSGSYCDLKFTNNRLTPIYMRVKCTSCSITCSIYGQSDGYEYSFESVISGFVPPPDEELVLGDEDKLISAAKEGVKSCGYLVKTKDGQTERQLLRTDSYAPVAAVRQIKRAG